MHAPFRSFGDGNGFEDLNGSRLDRPRKRHRSPSSTSSFLEPAALPVKPVNDEVDCKVSNRRKRYARHSDTNSQLSSKRSLSSSEPSVSPKRPTKMYERRSRHKIKEDRYELKQNKDVVKQRTEKDKKSRKAKKDKKLKLYKKSGTALAQAFAAQNVARDRLTVRLPHGRGLSHYR